MKTLILLLALSSGAAFASPVVTYPISIGYYGLHSENAVTVDMIHHGTIHSIECISGHGSVLTLDSKGSHPKTLKFSSFDECSTLAAAVVKLSTSITPVVISVTDDSIVGFSAQFLNP